MNLIDTLDLYALINDTDNLFLMLQDYPLDSRIDRNTMNSVIIKELGAMRPITTDPELFKMMFDTFFNKYSSNITKLIDTIYLEYNPIGNKDITETEKETEKETEHRHSVGDIDNTDKYTTNTDNTETGTSVTENQVSAYDVNTYQNKDKTITTPNTKIDNDVAHSGETTSDIDSIVDSTVDSAVDTEKHITGKDGDTSIQTLIEQERRLAEFNIFNWIIKQMRRELFLLVY